MTTDDEHIPSKSQRKRECDALQKLGEELLSIKPGELKSLELPDELNDAVAIARALKSNSALKRQRQYIGKIMRSLDSESIEKQIAHIKHKNDVNSDSFRRVEQWRDKLLAGDRQTLTELIDRYPAIDRQHINQLIRQAVQEQSKDKPPAAARKLFRYLRDLSDGG